MRNIKHALGHLLGKYRLLLVLLAIYFVLHLTNLTLLPIFNDEAIYLDWGWSYTHVPGHMYDSLLDAKQPLTIWIFGFFENFFADPLFAGRFASLLIGAVTLLGVFKIAKRLFDTRVAFFSALLFAITPIFVFYNRQALMEAGVMCVGIWTIYILLQLIHKPTGKQGVLLGAILGIGFLIKSSALLFVAAALFVGLFYILKKHKKELGKPLLLASIAFVVVNLVLFINPLFWQTFASNSRYAYTIPELLTFPLTAWISHLLGFFEIGFVFVTPFVFLFGVIGTYIMSKEKNKEHRIFVVFFLIALLLEIFSVKTQGQRYLVAFLPFLIIPASYVITHLWKGEMWKKGIAVVAFGLPLVITLVLVFTPDTYIMQLAKISRHSDVAYVRGQTSGYGITEVMEYIKDHSAKDQPTMVFFGLNAGNPESAVNAYAQKDLQLFGLHIDAKFFPGIALYPCMTSIYPAFFVTRNNELSGMDRYFTLEKSFPNPDGKYTVGVYALKKDCRGEAISLSDFYQYSMSKIWQIRSGNRVY